MHLVNLIQKNSPIALSFTFKAYKSAEDLYKLAKVMINTDEVINIEDDFGMAASIDMFTVAAVTFIECEKEMAKNGELQILQTKADLKTQANAKSDIGLRLLGEAANRSDFLPGERKIS